MSADIALELTELLDADERDLGFLNYLPQDTITRLTIAIRETLEADRSALDEAITQGTQNLPTGLGSLANNILG